MWCGRKNCLNQSDYHENWKKKNGNQASSPKPTDDSEPKTDTGSSEFKIVLAAMTSPEDFETLKKQFESLKD